MKDLTISHHDWLPGILWIIFFQATMGLPALSAQAYVVECLEIDDLHTPTLQVWSPQRKAKYTALNAHADALRAILFDGLAQSANCAPVSPLLRNAQERARFEPLASTFFANDGPWHRYTSTGTAATARFSRIPDTRWKSYVVRISRQELLQFLLEQKVIKSLQDGF